MTETSPPPNLRHRLRELVLSAIEGHERVHINAIRMLVWEALDDSVRSTYLVLEVGDALSRVMTEMKREHVIVSVRGKRGYWRRGPAQPWYQPPLD